MKKAISFILTALLVFSCMIFTGVVANAENFETESGVKITIADTLYKTTQYPMQFPAVGDYTTKISSTLGDYAIPGEINDLAYAFVFPAGTTALSCKVSLTSEGDWYGVAINSEQHSNYWEKDVDGNIDLTQPVSFRRDKDVAEQDEYGLLYRSKLYEKGLGGFKDYNKIYWQLQYTCNGEVYTDYFSIPLVNYDTPDKITVKALNYNIAGLPHATLPAMQRTSAAFIVENGYDIVAVQEDFNYHNHFAAGLEGYEYMTNHSGGVPGGDGLNIYTKSMPIYNETRVAWEEAYGVIDHGADELTPKGFIYSVIDIGDGIYVDFYNLHADAYGDEGSIQAREKQFKQLADFICKKTEQNNRPVIITGDFNAYMHRHEDNGEMYERFYNQCGLKDAWMEVHNAGNYFNLGKWFATGLPAWGNWDSVERFMYKGCDGVAVIATDFSFINVLDITGKAVSDHAAAECEFVFIKTDDFTENTQKLEVVEASGNIFINTVKWIFKDLVNIFTHLEQFPTAIKRLIEEKSEQ